MKSFICKLLLAPYYYINCRCPVQKNLVVFADGHQNKMPYSMQALAAKMQQNPDITIVEYFHDYSFCSLFQSLKIMLQFIPLYAKAEYVFICDCFLPTACCKKRPETTLVQLWHSGGLMKRVGQDSPQDRIGMMKDQYRNTDVFTASSPIVSDILSHALQIPRDKFSSAGINRMDLMYDEARIKSLRAAFDRWYPQYHGKKIILWAPTFRGNAHNGNLIGQQELLKLQEQLKDDYAIIIKTHRFSNSLDINTPVKHTAEQLLTFADALITDYSSIYFDFLFFKRPIILFAPDLEEYEKTRGLYPKYTDVPGYVAKTYDELKDAVVTIEQWANNTYKQQLDQLWDEQMSYCDGHSCDKLLKQLGLLQVSKAGV